ncbi:ARM repeat-containing protein [Amylocystis lapponica]|nr:ARM repeat-containing protein [Amylocystis lapponica]
MVAVAETYSPDELYNVVCGAASQNPAQMQASAERLKAILQLSGALDTLHEIAAQKPVPLPVRQQAIIQFKNTALGHWRARKLLTDEHRSRIRARCLTLLDEPDDTISDCNEVIVAKIARQDYPLRWKELVPDLMTVINANLEARFVRKDSAAGLRLRRSLEILNAVLKELVSVKMPSGIKIMGQLLTELGPVFQGYYFQVASIFLSTLNPSTIGLPQTAEDLLLAHLVFKCLSKLVIFYWHQASVRTDYENMQPWMHGLFQASSAQLQTSSELRINILVALQSTSMDVHTRRSVDLFTRHIRAFGKLYRRMQQLTVARFVALPGCSDLVLYYWSKVGQARNSPPEYIADSPIAVFPVRFLVQGMMLFKDSLAQWAPVRKNGTENERVLSKDFVEDAVRLLVTRFIPLNPDDLEEWMANPEGWVNVEEQDSEQWVYEIRPCAERVLMTLANQYHQFVVPMLETTFKQIAGQPSVDLASIIQKEALYCAIGRCASRLKDVIPFDQWLEHTLAAEARETNPSYPIIKRRIAWLIGRWVSDMCSHANNPKIWEVLVYLLQDRGPGSDAVVRLTAAIALRECVDSYHFDANVFAPFLPAAVNELVRLTAEADTLESKRRIAGSLNTVIEQAGTFIVPLIRNIAEPLPQLWTSAGEDWLFKGSLLVTLTKLIESAKEHSASLSSLVVALVKDSLAPGAQLHLDKDALNLWLAALRNSVTLESVGGGPGLLELIPILILLLSENYDLLGTVIMIVEGYILLDAAHVLRLHGAELLHAFVTALSAPAGLHDDQLAIALGLLLQIAPSQLWGETLHVSGLFAHVVRTLIAEKESTVLLTEYTHLLARVALADRQLFLQLMSATALAQNQSETILWESMLDQWFLRFDNMSEPRHRKLSALALANLVSTGRPEVMNRVSSEICNLWIDVMGEIKEALREPPADDDTTSGSSLLLYWDKPLTSYFHGSEDTLEYDRRKAYYDNDPVRTIQLTAFLTARLQEAEVVCGGAAAFQNMYLCKTDPVLMERMQVELGLRK